MSSLIILIIAVLFIIRTLRWAAINQQKEYRMDRLWAFFRSLEGKKELKNLINIPKRFSKSAIKRPVLTSRILAILGIFSLILILQLLFTFFLYELCITYELSEAYARILGYTLVYLTYLFIPFTIWIATIPTAALSLFIIRRTLTQAQQLIQKHNPTIIGITGSYGKTSTKLILDHILKSKYSVFTTPKSYNTRYSIGKSILNNYKGEDYAILEYGAYTKGEIKHLTKWFPPNIALITGITSQHLELFGSVDNIIKAKSELIKALPSNGAIFINGKDNDTKKVVKAAGREDFTDASDALEVTIDPLDKKQKKNTSQITFPTDLNGYLQIKYGMTKTTTKILGSHYKQNILLALHTANYLNIPPKDAINSLKDFEPSSQFIQKQTLESGIQIIDDGKTANPVGFNAAIDIAKSIKSPQKILLTSGIIDLGHESKIIHKKLAQKAQKVFQKIYYVGIDGQKQFQDVCEKKCITDINTIKKELKSLPPTAVVIIEGHIKKDILNALK